MLNPLHRSIYTIIKALSITLVAMFCWPVLSMGSPIDSYMVVHHNIDNGLPHNFVDDIYKDSSGFVWVSLGGGGLARFDGYEYLNYTPSSTIRTIAGDFVRNVVEDSQGRLWVATDNGLSIIDLYTLQTINPIEIDTWFKKYEHTSISSVYVDVNDRLWLCRNGGMDCVAFNGQGQISRTYELKYDALSLFNSSKVKDIDLDGAVWAGINGKLCKLRTSEDGGITLTPINIILPQDAIVNDIAINNQTVWVATDKGLVKHTNENNVDKLYNHDNDVSTSLSQDLVTSLAFLPEGYLIASTLNGINIYDAGIDGFIHETANNKDKKLNSNFVNCLLVDDSNIWVGTETGGINLYSAKNILTEFESYLISDPKSLSPNPVNVLYEDKDGILWVGVVEGGIHRKRLGEKGYEIFTSINSGINHNSVSALTVDAKDRLWVGTWGGGLDVIDRHNPRKSYIHLLEFGAFGLKPYIGALISDTINNGVWIGTSNGIYFYDLNKERLIEPFDPVENTSRGCIGAAIDNDNHLWIGTMQGLIDIDLISRDSNDKWTYRSLYYKLDDPASKVREKISSVFVDHDNTLWVGSDIHGLYKRINHGGKELFENININDGLVQNSVLGITEDKNFQLWISTNKGLSCYFPKNNRFINYTIAEGLDTDRFYWNAITRSESGHILIGAVDGLLKVNPYLKQSIDKEYNVIFTRLLVDNEPVILDEDISPYDISKSSTIRLHERNKSFSIEFSALDYSHNPACRYYYKLDGFEKEWIQMSVDRHFVSYTNIPPGKYRLMVSYVPDGSDHISEASIINIEVERYFYHTTWFILLLIALSVLIIIWVYKSRIKAINQKKIMLENAVMLRTAEISRQKQMLEERTMRVQELTVDRLSFFTNLTHEFRTPITLILGPVHRAIQICREKDVKEQLNYIERNAKNLLSLVNQLMDFRKIESGKMDIVRKRTNFISFLNEELNSFRQIAIDRNITIDEIVHMPCPDISIDIEAVRKLLTNLLSNAIKYTPNNGSITVYAALLSAKSQQDDPQYLYICVSDSGDGINPDDIDKVFDRFYQGKSFMKYPTMQASTGIGLHLCKCIVEAYGGKIMVKNNPVKGCRFRILIPVPLYDDETSIAVDESIQNNSDTDIIQHRRITIMLIDDSADMRGYIKTILSPKYDVIEAINGEEALNKLSDTEVDFIICDLMMPIMDGMEFTRKVRESFNTSHIPILMLTARTSDEAKLESYNTGVDDYICKPFSEEILLARIENILANKLRHQRQFTMDYNTDKLQLNETADKKFLDQVMEVVKTNYTNSYFEVGDFAEALGVSRSVLNKKLQNVVGQTANEFIRNYRLNLAHQIILQNRQTHALSISEIAYDVGFNDSKYFTRCFTKHFGVTPSSLQNGK